MLLHLARHLINTLGALSIRSIPCHRGAVHGRIGPTRPHRPDWGLSLETFGVVDVIYDIVTTIEPLMAQNASALEVHVAADVGTIYSDLTKIRQTVLNLLRNVCQFTEQGMNTLAVTRETMEGRDWLSLRVSDTGIGMSPKQLQVDLWCLTPPPNLYRIAPNFSSSLGAWRLQYASAALPPDWQGAYLCR